MTKEESGWRLQSCLIEACIESTSPWQLVKIVSVDGDPKKCNAFSLLVERRWSDVNISLDDDDGVVGERKVVDECMAVRVEYRTHAPRGGDFGSGPNRTTVSLRVTDVTVEHRLEEAAYRRDIVDHRLGNLTRTNMLLLEAKKYEELGRSLDLVKTEIDIRRGIEDELSLEQVSFRDLVLPVAQSVAVKFVGVCEDDLVKFFNCRDKQIPHQVVQVKVLLDIFSNIFKHGDCQCSMIVGESEIAFSNVVKRRDRGVPLSARTGLDAMRYECKRLGLTIRFDASNKDVFKTIIGVRTEVAGTIAHGDDGQGDSGANLIPTSPKSPFPRLVGTDQDIKLKALSYNWILVEDSVTLAGLWQHAMRKLRINLTTLCSAPEISNLPATLAYNLRSSNNPTVVVMDENVVELDEDFDAIPVSSTTIRKRLMENLSLRRAWLNRDLFFVLASAADVPKDQYCVTDIGKAGSTLRMIKEILDAISHRGLATTREQQPTNIGG